MTRETFLRALEFAEAHGELVTLGGGEPTVHPEFFEFLDKTMERYQRGRIEMPPLVVTNGKQVKKARKLLEYVAEERPVHVDLSLDDYHDPIHPEIEAAFKAHERERRMNSRFGGSHREGSAGIRTVENIQPVGRAAEPARGIPITVVGAPCCCEDLLVDPFGNVFSCGCKIHLLGNIYEDESFLDGFDREQAHYGGGLPDREHMRLSAVQAVAA
jgi:sulfatase maturation enzyme AslB (radical SAM superfamily)